jgi:hypothetical protein
VLRALRGKRYVCAVRAERRGDGSATELHLVALFDPAQVSAPSLVCARMATTTTTTR